MDTGIVIALITALSALAVAAGGWYANRRLRLPSNTARLVREEAGAYMTGLERKVTRLETELAEERKGREGDKADCLHEIGALSDRIVVLERVNERLMRNVGVDAGAQT